MPITFERVLVSQDRTGQSTRGYHVYRIYDNAERGHIGYVRRRDGTNTWEAYDTTGTIFICRGLHRRMDTARWLAQRLTAPAK